MAEVDESYELVERWVSALRSGEYIQNTSASERTKEYGGPLKEVQKDGTILFNSCGVLCDVYEPNGWITVKREPYNAWKPSIKWRNWNFWLDNSVLDELKIPYRFYDSYKMRKHVGMSFSELADYIEDNLLF